MIKALIANVPDAEQLPSAAVDVGEIMLNAVRLGVADAHTNLLEGNRVEGAVLGISLLHDWRVCVEQLTVGPQW